MARVKYDPLQVDQNFQIEEGIRETLRESSRAEVSASVIERSYELLDQEANSIEGNLTEKCEAIARRFGAKFFLVGENIVFEKSSRV